jgi:hypothetical protein
MFARWQKLENHRHWWNDDILWSAVLVKAVRVDDKPRQLYVGCIASIKQSQINVDKTYQHCWFWDHALERLHRFSVNEQDRERIIATLAEKVPVPTRAEYESCHRGLRELGIERPLPEHPLYELPASLLDRLKTPAQKPHIWVGGFLVHRSILGERR